MLQALLLLLLLLLLLQLQVLEHQLLMLLQKLEDLAKEAEGVVRSMFCILSKFNSAMVSQFNRPTLISGLRYPLSHQHRLLI